MAGSRKLSIEITGDAASAQRALRGVSKETEATGEKVGRFGRRMAVASGAATLAAKQIFDEWDQGVDALRAGTGATGEALEDLESSMKSVVGQVTQSVPEVGQVMADLNTRTGATGERLENLTKKFLDLNGRLKNTASVENVTRFFGDWEIATEDQSDALDSLFRASQASGSSIDDLSGKLVQFGAPLRNLGFSMEEAIALFAGFDQAGVNLETVMSGLRQAIGRVAKEGENVPETFRRVVEEIKNAEDASKATTTAIELFGQEAGPDLADAIRGGKFEIEEWIDTIKNGEDTIDQAAEDTLSLTDRLDMLKNRAIAVAGPFAELGIAVGGISTGIGGVLSVAGPLATKLGGPVKSAVSGLTTALVGRGGLRSGLLRIGGAGGALAVAGLALDSYMDNKREAKAITDDFVTALQQEAEGLRGATEEVILKRLADEGLLEKLQARGIATRDLIGAINGEEAAMGRVQERLKGVGPELVEMRGVIDNLAGGLDRARDRTSALDRANKDLEKQSGDSIEALRLMREEAAKIPREVRTTVKVDADTSVAAFRLQNLIRTMLANPFSSGFASELREAIRRLEQAGS